MIGLVKNRSEARAVSVGRNGKQRRSSFFPHRTMSIQTAANDSSPKSIYVSLTLKIIKKIDLFLSDQPTHPIFQCVHAHVKTSGFDSIRSRSRAPGVHLVPLGSPGPQAADAPLRPGLLLRTQGPREKMNSFFQPEESVFSVIVDSTHFFLPCLCHGFISKK